MSKACAQASKAYQHLNCHTELTTLVHVEADHKWKGSWKHACHVSEEALQCCISGLLTALCSPVQQEGGLDTSGWVMCRNPFEADGFLSFTWVQSHGKVSVLSLDFDSQSSVATFLSGTSLYIPCTNPCTSPHLQNSSVSDQEKVARRPWTLQPLPVARLAALYRAQDNF